MAAGEVQTVQTDKSPLGEVGDAPLEVVGLGQLGPLSDQGLTLLVEMTATGVELGSPTGHFGALDHARLVQVGEAAALGLRAITPALQSSQLDGEQLVVGDRPLSGHGGLASAEQVGTAEQLAYLVKDEGIELVGVDAPLGATPVRSTGTHQVAVRAGVIAGHAVFTPGPVGCELDPALATAHEASEQERVGLCPPEAENSVVTGGLLDGVKGRLGDDGRDGDLDPLLSWPSRLAVAPDGGVVARMGAVPEQPPHVGFVAQQAPDRGQGPHRPAIGRGDALGHQGDGEAPDTGTAQEIGKDPPHHGRFLVVHDEVGGALGPRGTRR